MLTRRKFLQNSLTATATGFVVPGLSFGSAEEYLSFDLHSHPGVFFGKGLKDYPGDAGVMKTTAEMNSGHLSGAFFSLVADVAIIERTPTGIRPTRAYATGEAWKEYHRQMNALKDLLKALPATLATTVAELDNATKNKKVAAFIACEGGDFLDGNVELLDEMYSGGVRSIQLVHYAPNALGDLQTEATQHNGLSKVGKEVVLRMNKLGMVVDVAHASFKTVQDVAGITKAPIILSHSILKMEDTRPLSRRAITPGHAKLVAGTGGVIGAWPSGFNNSFEEFVDNTLRLVDEAGVDHVGLGTDMDGNFKPVFGSYLQLPQWAKALKAKGLSNEEVGKILGGNARRVLAKVIK